MKYDWLQLKSQYLQGDWLSVSAFLEAQRLPNNSYMRTRTKGWRQERYEHQQRLVKQSLSLTQAVQLKGLTQLLKLKVRTVSQAKKLIIDGLKLEREAYGLTLS